MPYIKQYLREDLAFNAPKDSGELNYCITSLCDDYIQLQGKSYQTLNEVIGVLECAKQELYRRVVVPYEDEKIKQNGDVYTV